jgi:hypothetical protein
LVRGKGNVTFVGACILAPGYVDVQGADAHALLRNLIAGVRKPVQCAIT